MLIAKTSPAPRLFGEIHHTKAAERPLPTCRISNLAQRAELPLLERELSPAENFQLNGGLVTSSQLTTLLSRKIEQPISRLARWLASRQVIVLPSQSDLLLPLFQFDLTRMCLRTGVELTMLELSGVMNDEECAAWFSRSNAWLDDKAPAQVISIVPDDVVHAARAYRFVVTG